jgi:hypothetical protein
MADAALVARDPVLFDRDGYQEVRRKNHQERRAAYLEILARARKLRDRPLFARLEEMLASSRPGVAPDLAYSRTFSAWLGGLERELQAVGGGRSAECLDSYAEQEAFDRDLATEFPHLGLVKLSVPHEIIAGSIAVVPLGALMPSRRVGSRLRWVVFKHIDWDGPDAAQDRGAFRRGVRQVEDSLLALRARSPRAYENFGESVQSIPLFMVSSDADVKASSSADQPGTVIMTVSDGMLERRDYPYTASLLYHEHAHNKLALYLQAAALPLPRERVFVTPFQNEMRDALMMIHQVYPIAMECAARLVMIDEGARLSRVVEQMAATASRLAIVADLLPYIDGGPSCRATVRQLEGFARLVLGEIRALVEASDPEVRRRCQVEDGRVGSRRAWDVGQFLARGLDVRDPGLEGWARRGDQIHYIYRGVRHVAAVEVPRPTESRYRPLELS